MRVGLIAPPWLPVPPPNYGGTEAVVDRLARGLHAAGHDVLLAATGDSTCPVPMVTTIATAEPRMGAIVPELHHVMAAYDALREVDIVHDHTTGGPFYARCLPDLTVVTTNHNMFDDAANADYARIAERAAVLAISHSHAAAAKLPISGVIHHGIDVEDASFGTGSGGYLLFLGRMCPDKGAHRAVRVARAAGAPLRLAAKMRDPEELRYFHEQVEPLLDDDDDIRYVGEVGGSEKDRLLAEARALLNPIRWREPFGLVMIEALAAGTPVLTFPEGAAPEIVDDGVTGFLCDDERAMVAAVGRLDEIDRKACRREVEQRFSTERMVADHVACYERLLREAG